MLKAVRVCSICQDVTLPVTTYQVSTAGRSATTDRCFRHSKNLEAILASGDSVESIVPVQTTDAAGEPKPADSTPRPRRGGRRTRVVNMSDVEAARRKTNS